MDTFTLKLILTPTLIGIASLAGRRWGPAVSGWLVGLPFTSGPIVFFLALGQGAEFARAAALGILLGTLSQALVGLVYSWLALRFKWPLTLALSVLAFAGATFSLQALRLPAVALFVLVVLVLVLALQLLPKTTVASINPTPLPAWDIPARMSIATAYVVGLTGLAPTLGPHLTGLLSPFPLYALILAAFAHHFTGPAAAAQVLKGLLLGLFAFAAFFLVIASLVEHAPLALAFAAAIGTTLLLQGGSLWWLQRKRV